MRSVFLFAAALLVATTASAATPTKQLEEKASAPTLNAQTVQGCFKSRGDLKLNGTLRYNSKGSCAKDTCYAGGFPAGGTTGGNQCWCGSQYPPKADLVDDSNCNAGCSGYDIEACGGIGFWTIYNTGVSLSVNYLGEDPSASGSPTDGAVKTVTGAPVVVTQTSDSSSSGGTNVGAVAGGVSVAVIIVLSAIAGMFFYMRRKRNREIEEEHRRNAAVSSFISGKAPSSSSGGMSIMDARLDPVLAQRRMSDGSIADNQDYSRKILRVTNA